LYFCGVKILFLNYEFPPLGGGASPISAEIAEGYAGKGHHVDVVTMGIDGLDEREERNGLTIYRIPGIRKKMEICHPHEMVVFNWNAIRFLKKHLKDNSYDVCHCHFAIPTGIVANWVKGQHNIPYIITSHGSDIPGYNNDRFLFMHRFTRPILKKVLNGSSGNFAGSDFLSGLANEKLAINIPYKVIREGFHADFYQPAEKKPIILSTGRLLRRKGFQYLIEAVSHRDIGYEVHICGDGPMMEELKGLAKKSETKVVFHGWIDNKGSKYKELLESAAIYSLVSAKENASKSLLEAMSAGCATITSNVAGCPESVGDAGITLVPEDAQVLRQTLEELAGNDDLVRELGQKGRDRILNVYDWNKLIDQYLDVLRNVSTETVA